MGSELWSTLKGMHDQGMAATGLNPNSLQDLILLVSSPRLWQNVCFEACATKSWRQALGMAEWLSPLKSRWVGLSDCRCFVQAVFCSFFNWELWKLKCFYKRIWPAATDSLPSADFTPCHISIMLSQCLLLTNHVYDTLEGRMSRLLGTLYPSDPAYTLQELVRSKTPRLIFHWEIHWLPNEQNTPLSHPPPEFKN